MKNLMEDGRIDYPDFLARADMLVASGMTVLISDYFQYYRLAAYIGRYTNKMTGISMGIGSLRELFDEKYYTQLDGGILESFGRLFQNDLKLYIYPLREEGSEELLTTENLRVSHELRNLYKYLIDRGCINQLLNHDERCLSIFSRDVLRKIADGDESWEAMVPGEVAGVIKSQGYFGAKKS